MRFVNRHRPVLIATFRALALYGFAAWVYVALVALIQPNTLSLQLTHLTKWPRTDTFGEISFVVSLVSFWVQALLTEQREADGRGERAGGAGRALARRRPVPELSPRPRVLERHRRRDTL